MNATASAIIPNPTRTQLRERACLLASEVDQDLSNPILMDSELKKLNMKLRLAELLARLAGT